MLTRAHARATNQHVFVDDKWNDAYIQTKDEQIEMLHVQRVIKSWDDDDDSELEDDDATNASGGGGGATEMDEDRWITDDEGDEDGNDDEGEEDNEEADDKEADSDKPTGTQHDQQTNDQCARGLGAWLAGGAFMENVWWTAAAAIVVPVVLYVAATQCMMKKTKTKNKKKRRQQTDLWPLQSHSVSETLVKAYTNIVTVCALLAVLSWSLCGGGDVASFMDLFSTLSSVSSVQQRLDVCAARFGDGWTTLLAATSSSPSIPFFFSLNNETHTRLALSSALTLVSLYLLCHFHKLWLKTLVLVSIVGVQSGQTALQMRAARRAAIEIATLDPTFAFANESIFIAIDGQNLQQGATIAWVPYWGGLQHRKASECDKLFAQPLRNGGVHVVLNQLNEFVPCYAAPTTSTSRDFKCFENLRLRVKDQKSVPGWSLHTPAAPQEDREL